MPYEKEEVKTIVIGFCFLCLIHFQNQICYRMIHIFLHYKYKGWSLNCNTKLVSPAFGEIYYLIGYCFLKVF